MKKILSLILALVMACSLIACGGSKEEAPAAKEETKTEAPAAKEEAPAESGFDKEYKWSLATTYATGSVVVQMYERFAELCNEYTEGAITLTVFPDGTIASEDDAISQVMSGELEFCATGATLITSKLSPEHGWMAAPFMFESPAVREAVYNSDYWMAIRQQWAEENNILDLAGAFNRGNRTLVSKTKVESAADLQGLKLRMNSDAMWNAAWQAMGATTVTVSLGELYTSFQTGVVAACENPMSESGNLNIGEVAGYVMPTNHVAECAGIWMNYELFTSLPENYQAAVKKAAEQAFADCKPLVAEEEAMWLKDYQDKGCEYVENVDIESFRAASAEFWQEMFQTTWTAISYEDAMALIESCK